jgi:hypothetical protein
MEPGADAGRHKGEVNMPTLTRRKHPVSVRIKIAAIAFLSSIVTLACTLTRQRATPAVLCYQTIAVTDTPAPFITCYEAVIPSETPTPFTSPLATPTPTCYTPTPSPTPTTPTPEARHLLLEQLIAEGRLPEDVARQL